MNDTTIAILVFALGYIAGRLDTLIKLLTNTSAPPTQGFFAKDAGRQRKQSVDVAAVKTSVAVADIDDSLYVGSVSTDNLVKTNGAKLGTTSTTADNIGQSVSKLAQLKSK